MSGSIIRRADGKLIAIHDPEHKPIGDPCHKCGMPMHRHRVRARRLEKEKRTNQRTKERKREAQLEIPIVHIDGEGIHGIERDGIPHTYIYLSAVDENGIKLGSLFSLFGLTTVQILDWLIDLETNRVFGYSLGYDFTKWLADMPAELLYKLVRPEQRAYMLGTRHMHAPVVWSPKDDRNGYKFTYLRRRLQIQRCRRIWDEEKKEWQRKWTGYGNSIVVWDVFAFFQGKFIKALTDWNICSAETIKAISDMKDEREDLSKFSPDQIAAYCDSENENGGKLVRSLINAHERAELPLRSFYGAGSTSSALLTKLNVKESIEPPPDEMMYAVLCAFFGGRFELSEVGPLYQEVFNHDISSAYPYAMCFLPCLVHGKWKFIRRNVDSQIRSAKLALCHSRVRKSGPSSWGPLPFRDSDGNITFPLSCESTWVWKDEYLAAKDTLWSGSQAFEAWVYNTDCNCQPFKDIPRYYIERLKLGKDGPGIVLKLGINGGYGKLAQSEGAAPFRSMVYAGNITSLCRAMGLQAIATAKDPRNVKMIATDGLLATERLSLAAPTETGSGEPYFDKDKKEWQSKPLGGWEIDSQPKGVMLCRPGIYYPLNPTEKDLKKVRARGIHRGTLLKHADRIVQHFTDLGPTKVYDAGTIQRFLGAKQGIGIGSDGKPVKRKYFGEWCKWPVQVSFNPVPKRKGIESDYTLTCWTKKEGESQMYDKGVASPEAIAMKLLQEVLYDSGDDIGL